MSHGKSAEWHGHRWRDYESLRLGSHCNVSRNSYAKRLTHRRERSLAKLLVRTEWDNVYTETEGDDR